jgi:hypothetical protein
LAGEGGVNRNPLPRNSGRAGRVVTGGSLLEFDGKADGTLIENRFAMRKLGDAVDMFMGMKQIVIAGMCEPLVPQKLFSLNVKFVKAEILGHSGFMK